MSPSTCDKIIPLYESCRTSLAALSFSRKEYASTPDIGQDDVTRATTRVREALAAYRERIEFVTRYKGENLKTGNRLFFEFMERSGYAVDSNMINNVSTDGGVRTLAFKGMPYDDASLERILRPASLLDELACIVLTGLQNLEIITRLPEGTEELLINTCPNLQRIDTLPEKLKTLECEGCKKLKVLPGETPDTLGHLMLDGSESIASLPRLNRGLKWLYAADTRITTLPALPDTLETIDISGTPAAKEQDVRDMLEAYREEHGLSEGAVRY